MCAIFGFLDYDKKISPNVLKNLIRALSVAAESRGTDATGIMKLSIKLDTFITNKNQAARIVLS